MYPIKRTDSRSCGLPAPTGLSYFQPRALWRLRGNGFSSFPGMRQQRIKQVWGGPATRGPALSCALPSHHLEPQALAAHSLCSLGREAHQPEVVGGQVRSG